MDARTTTTTPEVYGFDITIDAGRFTPELGDPYGVVVLDVTDQGTEDRVRMYLTPDEAARLAAHLEGASSRATVQVF